MNKSIAGITWTCEEAVTSCDQVVNKFWACHEENKKKNCEKFVKQSWTSCEQVMDKLRTSCDQVANSCDPIVNMSGRSIAQINNLWTSNEKVMNKFWKKLWKSCEQVVNKFRTGNEKVV